FEFKRHRMMTQTVQPLTADLGFAIPRGITAADCQEEYLAVMRKAGALYQRLAQWNLDVASYIIPNSFNRRIFFSMNLRQAFNFCRLRAAENAHFSIRRIAIAISEKIREIYPLLGAYLDVNEEETSRSIQKRYFSDLCVL
ncbi:MAG: FAD-dependent thymidylate synthase, partial [Anaerolineales bacterium]